MKSILHLLEEYPVCARDVTAGCKITLQLLFEKKQKWKVQWRVFHQRQNIPPKCSNTGNSSVLAYKPFWTLPCDLPKYLRPFYVANLPQVTSNTAAYSMASSAPPFSQTLMSKLKIVMLYSIVDNGRVRKLYRRGSQMGTRPG